MASSGRSLRVRALEPPPAAVALPASWPVFRAAPRGAPRQPTHVCGTLARLVCRTSRFHEETPRGHVALQRAPRPQRLLAVPCTARLGPAPGCWTLTSLAHGRARVPPGALPCEPQVPPAVSSRGGHWWTERDPVGMWKHILALECTNCVFSGQTCSASLVNNA